MDAQDPRRWAEFWDQAMLLSLVAAGIVGVAIAVTTRLSIKYNGIAREADAAELDRYKAEAGERISAADLRAADAIKKAADLGVTVDNLTQVAQEKAGEANLAIAALAEATAKAAAKVDAVGEQVAAVHEQQKARQISFSSSAQFAGKLAAYPKQIVLLDVSAGDSEAQTFANNVKQILEVAGWIVKESSSMSFPTQIGISIAISDVDLAANNTGAADVLMSMFQNAGYQQQLSGHHWKELDKGQIKISIGVKPAIK